MEHSGFDKLCLATAKLGFYVSCPIAEAVPQNRVAFVFGWSLASPKIVEKFSQIYLEQGFCVVSCTNDTVFNLHFPRPIVRDRVRKLLLLLEPLFQSQSGDHVAVVHVLSNGGLNTYLHFLDTIQPNGEFQHWADRLRCAVFDSAPADWEYFLSAREATGLGGLLALAGLPQRGVFVFLLRQLLWLIGVTHRLGFVRFMTPEQAGHERLLAPSTPKPPTLFIYSTTDALTDYRLVEIWCKRMEGAGTLCTLKLFEGTQHLGHLRAHPKLYRALVTDFLADAQVLLIPSVAPITSEAKRPLWRFWLPVIYLFLLVAVYATI